MQRRILMIEDERALVLSVGDRLRKEGYAFESAADGDSGLRRGLAESFDLALVDVMLPGKNGFEIVRALRTGGVRMPLLLLTARDAVIDRVSGLRAGADDYIPKPFSMDELVARIEAHLRRAEETAALLAAAGAASATAASAGDGTGDDPGTAAWLDTRKPDFNFGPFTLRYRTACLLRGGQKVPLTYQELRLLCLLVERQGEVVDGDTLLNLAWGYGAEVSSRTLYVHIAWLRKKLETPESPEGFIRTVRRVGYLFTT